MYLYFNKKGNLTTAIPHGEKVRQGGYLNLVVCLDSDFFLEKGDGWTCNVELSFPNGKLGTTFIADDEARHGIFEKVSDSEVTYDLVDGRDYLMYEFRFAPEQATTEAGKIDALVSIVKTNADLTKQGTAKDVYETDLNYFGRAEIYVEKTFGYNKRVIDESSLHYKNLMKNINNLDSRKMNKDQVIEEIENRSTDREEVAGIIESYMEEAELLDIGTNENLDISSDTQIPTSKTVDTMLKEERLTAGKSIEIDYENKKIDVVVDNKLENDSKNPVENRTIKTELDKKQNLINNENKLDYSLLKNVPYIPNKVSDLQNDKKFIDKTVENLENYYTKAESYNKDEVQKLLSAISSLKMEIVETLPTANVSTTTIYLKLRDDAEENNVYEEYVYINNKWEMIGTTSMNVEGLATEEYVDKRIESFHPIYEYEIPELEGATWFRFAEVLDESKNSSAIFTMDLYGTRISEEEQKMDINYPQTLAVNTEYNFKFVGNLQNYINCINSGIGFNASIGDYNIVKFYNSYENDYVLIVNNENFSQDYNYFTKNELVKTENLPEEIIISEDENEQYIDFDLKKEIVKSIETKYCKNAKRIAGTIEISGDNLNGGYYELSINDETLIEISYEEEPFVKTAEIDIDVSSIDKLNVSYQGGGVSVPNRRIVFKPDYSKIEFELEFIYKNTEPLILNLTGTAINEYSFIPSLFRNIKTYKEQMLTTSVFAASCNELNGKIISDVLPISQSYDLSGTDASGGATGSGDPIGGGSGGGEVGSGGGSGGGNGGSLYYGLGAITLEQLGKERYVCGLVNFPSTTQFKDLRVKLKIENNLNFKALSELEVVDLKEENQNDLQLLEGTELEADVSYNFVLKGNLKKFLDNKENYETGVDIYFAAEEGVMPEKIELFKDFAIYRTADEPININTSGGGSQPGGEINLLEMESFKKRISYNFSNSGRDVLSKVSGTLILTGNGFVNPKINGEEIEYDEETGTYRKYYENVEDSEAKVTAEVSDENGGSYFYQVNFLVNAEQCEVFYIEPYKTEKNRVVDYYEIKNNDVFDFNLKLQEQILHIVSKSYELFSVFDKLSEVDKKVIDAKQAADSAYSLSSMLSGRLQILEEKRSLGTQTNWMYEPILEDSSNVTDLLYDVMNRRQLQWINSKDVLNDTYLIYSDSNNLYSYLAQSRTEEKWNDEIGDYQKVMHISISQLILPTDKYPDQPLIGKIFAEVPYIEYYFDDGTRDYWEYDITEDMYTAEKYGGSGGVEAEDVLEIINNNSTEVEELDIGTSENFDINSDTQVPTSKAIIKIVESYFENGNEGSY